MSDLPETCQGWGAFPAGWQIGKLRHHEVIIVAEPSRPQIGQGEGIYLVGVARRGYPAGLEATIDIESIAFGGAGVGRLPDGRACFVPGTLPGERALVKVLNSKKSYAEAEVVRLAEASARRVRPVCPVFGVCGGCAYQHAEYSLQLEIKTGQVSDLLRRVGGLPDADVRAMRASPIEWGYRNRLSAHVRDGRVGFPHRHSHRIVEVSRWGTKASMHAWPKFPQRLHGAPTG